MTDPTRTRAEAIVNKFIMDTKDNSYTVIEGDDASELVIMLTQALDAERKAALEEAATVAEGDQEGLPMDSWDMDVGMGMVDILAPDMTDQEAREKMAMILAEHRSVTRQEERKAIAQAIRQEGEAS